MPTANEVLATRAVAEVRRVVPELDEQRARSFVVEVMRSAELFRSLVDERNIPFDVAGLRYYLRTLESAGTANVLRGIAVGDALVRAMSGD
jgi:hypothetical protein